MHTAKGFQLLLSNTNSSICTHLNSFKYCNLIIIIIIIMSCRQHGYPSPSLVTSPYRLSPLAGLQGYIPYPHIAAECMFVLVVLLLPGYMWGSIGVHHLWVRPCFFSSVLHQTFICSQLNGFKYNKWLNSPILYLTGTTTLGQSQPGSNGNERVLYMLPNSRTKASLSDSLESYLGHTLGRNGGQQRCSRMSQEKRDEPSNK